MEVRTFPVGSYQTNCYLAWGADSDTCILIDPGYEPEYLLEQVRLSRKTLEAILLTHGHFDHVGGVKQIAEETGCKVYICPEELLMPQRFTAGPIYHTDTYGEGDVLSLAGLQLQVIKTPGHTQGSVCLLCEDTLFSGDTLFAGTCGRTDLPGGDYQTILSSLRRLSNLEGDYKVLPGHGRSSTLAQERIENPYLQLC
jgi:glyoxylase-like metal-dependent hydrolase (beta-lactamase superfamily II)